MDTLFEHTKVYELTIWKGKCSVCGKLFHSCIEKPKHCSQAPEAAFGVEKTIKIMKVYA